MAKHKETCTNCKGTGYVLTEEKPCEIKIITPQGETIHCWAVRSHTGIDHAALLEDPCPRCGGYDEHLVDRCPGMLVTPTTSHWYRWSTSDRGLTVMNEAEASVWVNGCMAPVV